MTYKSYRIINKITDTNYIKFELNDNVEFGNGNYNFVFCANEYPFKNCRVGEEIEVNLTNAKRMSSQNFHQGIIKKASRSYVGGYTGGSLYDGYGLSQDEREESGEEEASESPQFISAQKQKSLHQMKLLLGNFHYMLEPLENYIEKAGYYPNFRSKRQLYQKSIKSSNGPLENDEDLFLTQLFVFAAAAHGKPEFMRKVIQEEFYKWIDYTGITAGNCPERLKHFLIEVNNVLEGSDSKIITETRKMDKNVEIDPRAVTGIFSSILQPLNRNREQRVTLEGKVWNELGDDDKFEGNPELGKQSFEQIRLSVSVPHEQFALRKSEAEILREMDELIERGGVSMEGVESSNPQSGGLGFKRESVILGKNDLNVDNSNNSNLGTIALITAILALASLGIYGIVKKTKKIKK